jgi:dipeptidase
VQLTYVDIEQSRETNAVLLSRPHWIWGAEIGTNAHGLVIGNEAIFAKREASAEPGIIGMDYVRLALERARDVDEAIHVITTLLRVHGQSGNCGFSRVLTYNNSFLLADYRSAKVLETVDREWAVVPVADFAAISNVMSIETGAVATSPTLVPWAVEAGLHAAGRPFSFRTALQDPNRIASGQYRRGRALTLLSEVSPQVRVPDLFRLLRDHEEGPRINGREGARICTHRRENPIGQTTASWVADLTPGRTIHWATATAAPCRGLFKPLVFEAGVPAHGPRPGAEPDDVSLWWRHERLRRLLAESDATEDAAFIAERDELEAKFFEAIATCPWEQAAQVAERGWREAVAFENCWLERCTREARGGVT